VTNGGKLCILYSEMEAATAARQVSFGKRSRAKCRYCVSNIRYRRKHGIGLDGLEANHRPKFRLERMDLILRGENAGPLLILGESALSQAVAPS
jgi:hypothetical protein